MKNQVRQEILRHSLFRVCSSFTSFCLFLFIFQSASPCISLFSISFASLCGSTIVLHVLQCSYLHILSYNKKMNRREELTDNRVLHCSPRPSFICLLIQSDDDDVASE